MAGNFIELGVSGLKQFGGYIHEEWLRKLTGEQGRRTFREMSDNDSVIGAILFAIEMLLRNVDWRVESFDDSPDRKEEAEFVESCVNDMSHTWEDFVAEALTMLPFGWSAHEIVYKRRSGPEQSDPRCRSKFRDDRVGWRKLPLRSQDTLDRWEFDDDGGISGLYQIPPQGGGTVFIPVEKLLLFRTTSRKSNPEGRSVLRNAYLDWYHKTRIANYEAIGVERDLAGLPMFYLPPEMTDPDADANIKAQLAEYKRIGENIRNDEQACLLMPSHFDEHGNRTLEFSLLSTGSRRMFDTSKIIERYSRQIAMTVLADFIMLGHERVGSLSLSSDKTELFATALGAWLKEISSVMNRHAIPRLYRLNGLPLDKLARLEPGDIEQPDLDRFATALNNLVAAGFLTPGSEADEDRVRQIVGMPPTPADLMLPPDDGDMPAPLSDAALPEADET